MPEEQTTPEQEKIDKTAARLEQCRPVAKFILEQLAANEIPLGDFSEEERIKAYSPIATAVLDKLAVAGVKYIDISYVFQLVMQAFQNVSAIIAASTETSLKNCQKIKWGKNIYEVTLNDMDEILTAYQSATSTLQENTVIEEAKS